MKTNHKNIAMIEDWIDSTGIHPSLDDDFVRLTYESVLENLYKIKNAESIRRRDREYRLQYDFVRRDILKIIYKRNNFSATGIKAGFVYAIGNPAWKEFVKVGSAIDVIDRLCSYQTSSPLRDYYIIDYYFAHDRLKEECEIHSLFERNSEWCKVSHDGIRDLFKHRKKRSQVSVTNDKLFEVKLMRENKTADSKKKAKKKS